jgi:DNA-binding transcriptional regulator PaaX
MTDEHQYSEEEVADEVYKMVQDGILEEHLTEDLEVVYKLTNKGLLIQAVKERIDEYISEAKEHEDPEVRITEAEEARFADFLEYLRHS